MNANRETIVSLHPKHYTDTEIFQKEVERIFFRNWQLIGHVSQVAKPGDFFTFRYLDQSLFVMRGQDGELRAFYNVCQHRAHEVVEGSGNKEVIACPYHAWVYTKQMVAYAMRVG